MRGVNEWVRASAGFIVQVECAQVNAPFHCTISNFVCFKLRKFGFSMCVCVFKRALLENLSQFLLCDLGLPKRWAICVSTPKPSHSAVSFNQPGGLDFVTPVLRWPTGGLIWGICQGRPDKRVAGTEISGEKIRTKSRLWTKRNLLRVSDFWATITVRFDRVIRMPLPFGTRVIQTLPRIHRVWRSRRELRNRSLIYRGRCWQCTICYHKSFYLRSISLLYVDYILNFQYDIVRAVKIRML